MTHVSAFLPRRRTPVLASLAVCGLLVWTSTASAQVTPANAFNFHWHEPGLREHPLIGKVWSTAAAGFVAPASLATSLSGAHFVLLGEVHDNADAHELQGWAIRKRAASKPVPGVVFEHIRTDQADALRQFDEFDGTARRPATVHDLLRFLDWKTSPWPSQDKMLGLFGAVFNPRLPIYPASPPREQVRAMARGGASALSAEDRARIQLDDAFEPPLSEALTVELKGSHCGMIPDTAIPAMSIAQRYRDAAFADAMLTAAAAHGGAILVAGNGHVRTDRAVPWYLRRRAPDRTLVSLMMLEVEEGAADPAAYVPRAPNGTPAADFVVFTPRAERPDPCATLRQRPASKG